MKIVSFKSYDDLVSPIRSLNKNKWIEKIKNIKWIKKSKLFKKA